MNRKMLQDTLGWGLILWLVGYALGMILFPFVPVSIIGWVIMPVGVAMTVWVAFAQIRGESPAYFGMVAIAWVLLAMLGDYLFIVKALKPADGYYKPDVYVYYALTIAIPLFAGWKKTHQKTVALVGRQ